MKSVDRFSENNCKKFIYKTILRYLTDDSRPLGAGDCRLFWSTPAAQWQMWAPRTGRGATPAWPQTPAGRASRVGHQRHVLNAISLVTVPHGSCRPHAKETSCCWRRVEKSAPARRTNSCASRGYAGSCRALCAVPSPNIRPPRSSRSGRASRARSTRCGPRTASASRRWRGPSERCHPRHIRYVNRYFYTYITPY